MIRYCSHLRQSSCASASQGARSAPAVQSSSERKFRSSSSTFFPHPFSLLVLLFRRYLCTALSLRRLFIALLLAAAPCSSSCAASGLGLPSPCLTSLVLALASMVVLRGLSEPTRLDASEALCSSAPYVADNERFTVASTLQCRFYLPLSRCSTAPERYDIVLCNHDCSPVQGSLYTQLQGETEWLSDL